LRALIVPTIQLFGGAVVGLWVLDVLVNLGLAGSIFGVDRRVQGLAFFGLLIGHVQVAFVCTLLATAGGALAALVLRSRDPEAEALPLLLAALAGVCILVEWGFTRGALVGLVVWTVMRVAAWRGLTVPSVFIARAKWLVWPLLLVGFVNQGLRHADEYPVANFVAAGCALVLGIPALWMSTRAWARGLGWLPLVLACMIAHYGPLRPALGSAASFEGQPPRSAPSRATSC
jgi:hypothetical protein